MMLLKLLLPILALLGMLDASYITYEKFSGRIPQCLPGFSCAQVLESPWANIGPIPLAVLGLFYYSCVLILSSIVFLEKRYLIVDGKKFSTFGLLRLLTGFGFLFSLYLIFIMAILIKGWCLWCLMSALTCALLFLFTNTVAVLMKLSGDPDDYPVQNAIMALLYQRVLKPVLFLLNPEIVHHHFVQFGNLMGSLWPMQVLTAWLFSYSNPSLSKTIAGITFPNPVGLSAGFDYDGHLTQILPSVGFGFATLGTVTLEAYEGNPRPMLSRLPNSRALIVNKGFKSEGAIAVIKRLEGKMFRIPVGISIGSTNRIYRDGDEQIANIIECFKLFEASKVHHSYYELNISCPNTKGGQPFTDVTRLDALLKAFDKLHVKKPVFIKMPIDKSEAETKDLLTRASKSRSITGIIIGNLTKDHSNPDVDPEDRKIWNTATGNLSGKPTWNRSNHLIAMARKTFGKRFVIIGTGGIFSGEDAQEKMRLGADLVQLITGMIYQGPNLLGEINWTLSQRVE